MAQGSEFPLRKPPGFHWDFFLLGITTFIAGLLGLPAPNGLIPQAPIHTTSLVIMGRSRKVEQDEETPAISTASTPSQIRSRFSSIGDDEPTPDATFREEPIPDLVGRDNREVAIGVVEQRVSNLAQGSLCLVLLTGPFLHVLSLIPGGVLAGLL